MFAYFSVSLFILHYSKINTPAFSNGWSLSNQCANNVFSCTNSCPLATWTALFFDVFRIKPLYESANVLYNKLYIRGGVSMNCMRCGKEIQQPQVFCDTCLAAMDAHPVKPDIHVHIPVRPIVAGKTPGKKAPPSLESQIRKLRRRNKNLVVALICALLALVLSGVLIFHLSQSESPAYDIGKNYSTVNA